MEWRNLLSCLVLVLMANNGYSQDYLSARACNPTIDHFFRLTMFPVQIQNGRLNKPSASDIEWIRRSRGTECSKLGHPVIEQDGMVQLSWH